MKKKLREEACKWPNARKETRQSFIQPLRRIARKWPEDEIARAIGDLARRAKLLYRTKRQIFDESAEMQLHVSAGAAEHLRALLRTTHDGYKTTIRQL